MRIAHIVPSITKFPPEGDQGRYHLVRLLVDGLISRRHDVTLFARADSETPAKLESVELLPRAGRSRIEKLKNITLSTNLLLSKLYQQANQFDIIHSHFNDKHLFFAPLVKTPTVVTQHWPITDEMKLLLAQTPSDQIHIVPISQAQRDANPDLNYTEVVYNGIEVAKFTFQESAGDYLANLSRVTPEKGTLNAIEVANRTKIPLKIIGKSQHSDSARAYWPKVEKALAESAYAEYQEAIPHEEVSEFLGNAKALLFPIEWEEPFGLVMVEAMATGTPVIAFRRGSVSEIVVDGVTGFIVDTVDEMVAAVSKLDQIDRAACRQHVAEHFDIDPMITGYEHVYERLVNQ